MSIKGMFVQVGGYREVAKSVEVPVDFEKSGFCRPGLPEGKRRNRCLLVWMSVPAKMNNCK
jgi:hypothetical protein